MNKKWNLKYLFSEIMTKIPQQKAYIKVEFLIFIKQQAIQCTNIMFISS